jgi:DNA-binding response OmpR family regulator
MNSLLQSHQMSPQSDTSAEDDAETLTAGIITIHTKHWLVSVSGVVVDLTYLEYLLLKALVVERGKVISRDALLERVWRYGNVSLLETRKVDVHVGRLRKKLGEAGDLIITVRNVGYRMAFSPEWITR